MHTADGKFFPFDEQKRPLNKKKRRTVERVRRVKDKRTTSMYTNMSQKYIGNRDRMNTSDVIGIGKTMSQLSLRGNGVG